MRSKRLTLEESRKLVWLTWCEFLVVGIIVYFFTNPMKIALVFLPGPIALHALINFWVRSVGVPVTFYSIVPTVFMPTAFLTGCAALVMWIVKGQIFNSWTLAPAVVCALCVMVIYPESRYSDYD